MDATELSPDRRCYTLTHTHTHMPTCTHTHTGISLKCWKIGISPFAIEMNLEDIVASEVSKSETDKISHGLNYLLCERKKNTKQN